MLYFMINAVSCLILVHRGLDTIKRVFSLVIGKGKGKGSGVWPSMVTHTRNLSSAFNPSKCTLTAVNTQPGAVGSPVAAPGEQLGDRCLAQGSHLSRGIEGGESTCYSLPPPTIPAGPGNRTCNLLGYKSNSLTIRPRLPLKGFFAGKYIYIYI